MLSDDKLLLAVRELAKTGQKPPVLLLLAHVSQPAPTSTVRDKGVAIGFRAISQWNLSAILRSAADDGYVAQLAKGWKLLEPGLKVLEEYYHPEAPIISEARHALKEHVAKLTNADRRRFMEEAVLCFDAKAHRAAVVLSWVGAAHIVEEHILENHLVEFNRAGTARFKQQFSSVRSIKDFAAMSESDILQLCQDCAVLDKAEKQELQARLDLRNRCGHPNAITIAEHVVASHIETLLLNVYSKY